MLQARRALHEGQAPRSLHEKGSSSSWPHDAHSARLKPFFHRDHWLIRDLGSTNGSYVNDQRVEAGQTVRLARGSELWFGKESAVLESVQPPTVCASCLDTNRHYSALNGVITLPDEADPLVTVFQGTDGSWFVEHEDETKTATDGEVLHAAGRRFRLHIPSAGSARSHVSTQEGSALIIRSKIFELVFNVSSDQESIEVELHAGSRVLTVPPRQAHEVLLELARTRLQDRADGVAEGECGWVYAGDLATRLAYQRSRLNVAIHRIRRQLAEVGLVDAAQVFERRPMSQQLRLGITQLRVVPNRASAS